VRTLAVWREDKGVKAAESETAGIGAREAAILAGPRHAIERVLEELRRRCAAALPQAA
jgi:hypothetical protein